MKNKLVYIICVILCMLTLISCFGPDMSELPEGEFLHSSMSPEGTYRVDAYVCSGNATTDFSVRCSVTEVDSNEERNFYWAYHYETADIQWIDDTTVVINGIQLDVTKDSYDWRE